MADSFLENTIVTSPKPPKKSEVPGTFGFETPRPQLPRIRNCALDPFVAAQVDREIMPVIFWVRANRVTLEEEWRAISRMEMQLHDGGRRYFGRSDSYLPVYARNRQSYTSALSRGLFPSDEYMDVADRNDDYEKALAVKNLLQWEFERVARLRSVIKPFVSCLASFGNAPLKIAWKHAAKGKNGNIRQFATNRYSGLRVSPRHPLQVYVYPTSANTLDECTMLFEDIEVTRQQILEMGDKNGWVNIPSALRAPISPNYNVNQSDIHSNIYGLTPPTTNVLAGLKLGDVQVLTEVWTYLVLPKDQYLEDEDVGDAVPCQLILAGNVPIWVSRNPFFHQQPPYRWARMNTFPSLFYGYGIGRISRPMQYLVNDFANQANDVGIYSLNPIVMVNAGLVHGGLRPLAPGVPWYVGDVDKAVKFQYPPTELIGVGLQAMNQWISMEKDLGGTPDVMQGLSAGKGARTATGAQILQQNTMAPLQDVVEDLEYDIFEPLMYMTWVMEQQFREDAIEIAVAGRSLTVDPADLVIDPEMMWMAANQSTNRQQRSQAAMQFAQTIQQAAMMLIQQGYVPDIVPILRKVWSDGLGFRNFDSIITANPQKAQQLLMQQQQQEQQPDQTQAPGDRVRSTLEQVTGQANANDMAPGEGEAFGEVRDGADELSSMLGGLH